MIEEIEEQSERFAQEAVNEDFKWLPQSYNEVRENTIRKRVRDTISDLKFDLINCEIYTSKVNKEKIGFELEIAGLKEIISKLRGKYE